MSLAWTGFPFVEATSRRPVWGDGLVEQSLSTLYYCHSWHDVDDDELVFYLPGLAAAVCDASTPLAPELRAVLGRRAGTLRSLLRRFGEETGQLAIQARSARNTWMHTPQSIATDLPFSRPELRTVTERLEAAIDCLAAPSAGRALSFTDALLLSIHTQCNGAYLNPRFGSSHMMFTCAAWIGLIAYGRSALLPPSIAEGLGSYLAPAAEATPDGQSSDRVLQRYADWCAGRGRLLQLARRSAETGSVILVKPKLSLL